MYRPEAFAEDRLEPIASLIQSYPLGLLITVGADGPAANPVPFELSPDGRKLRAHLARANPQLDDLRRGEPVLVVFQGEQSYITPSWYATKQATGKVVPTWNYLMVQARGRPALTNDADWLHDQIDALTRQMESAQPTPWAVTDAPDGYVGAMLRGIVGVEIDIQDLRGKWKAGQNKTADDRAGVRQGLSASHPALAAATGEA
ncbi:FMN-binding negative transcriptional regulator [Paracoccus tegillarcae]|uniref:Transcriptional regulator n=1 Tax=Paracoccus tegillarcae TaxID=1529068 RepID=A0A2K9F170_9RHOB|nr:FMN-binding negative transcriptional regulator [Paracoccus tegillarcae]AUH34112.1 transcriptional regulator [Paracoccus tegillarcae]